ncbi:Oidioi.mRNA.OKI2018_I69.PAR.g11188.t1.cds [Oikopleura dioica]|uniref:Oidioi.mRNA.OKI2018_I69.PAR.g11188.t1.cds n=1 Tax=Oikopleura dioica TaxID=34765 RepID=A0ABN7S1V2_OIKDI|nr:Oidioi.mRNA.OKI2018_I69.PAR.g11188.t1.cds [Oikopleura dioica]
MAYLDAQAGNHLFKITGSWHLIHSRSTSLELEETGEGFISEEIDSAAKGEFGDDTNTTTPQATTTTASTTTSTASTTTTPAPVYTWYLTFTMSGSGATVQYIPGITKDPAKRGIFGWGYETQEINPKRHHSHKVLGYFGNGSMDKNTTNWHFSEDARLWSKAINKVLAASNFTEEATVTTVRNVNAKDKYAPLQTWRVENLDPDFEPQWKNFSFHDYQEEIMLRSDAFAKSYSYPVDQFTNEWFYTSYDYWIQSLFEFTTTSYGNSNYTTHSGADHFFYGENFESEFVEETTVRGLPAEKWSSALGDGTQINQYFIHPNFTTFSNRSVPLLVEFQQNGTWEGDEIEISTRWDIFYMIDKFERHQMDSIVGEDPFRSSSFFSPKFGDCDKGVTQMEINSTPDSLANKNVDTKLEMVNVQSKNVYASHLRFDVNNNLTRMDYYDFEEKANVRVVEMKSLDAQFTIDMSTGSCKVSKLIESFDWIKNKGPESPADIFGVPTGAFYNQPSDVRQNIFSDAWQDVYETELDFGPGKGINATCVAIYHYPGVWLEQQDNADMFNAETGMLLSYENQCYGNGSIQFQTSANNFGSRNRYFAPDEFDLTPCFSSGSVGDSPIYDIIFSMTEKGLRTICEGPFDALGNMQQIFADAVLTQIQVQTGLEFMSRLQHLECDLFTDFEIENPEIIIKFSLLPQVASYEDGTYKDLSNDQFMERISEPINDGYFEVEIFMNQKDLQFLTIKDSLAISQDGGLTYEPVSNKTRVITRIHHEKGYKPVGVAMMCLFGLLIVPGLIFGATWFRFRQSSGTGYENMNHE